MSDLKGRVNMQFWWALAESANCPDFSEADRQSARRAAREKYPSLLIR